MRGAVSFRRLSINGKFLGAKPTGVHRVAEQLIRQLFCRRDELRDLFHEAPGIIAPRNVRDSDQSSFALERGGLVRGQLWEQLDLPRLARRDLLLNLCNLGPMASTAAITMIHDAQVFITPESYSWAFAKWYRNVLPVIGHRHVRILAVSEFSAAQLVRFGVARPEQISVISNGVDHLLAHEPLTKIVDRLQLNRRKFVVALANVQAHKNVGLLLRAFADPALAGIKLVLVGAAGAKEFEALGHSIPQGAVFTGRIEDGELRALLEAALCLAFPSTTEGFGLPPLEGMTVGCPAVLAPCGALPEVGGDAAMFAAADDPRKWVEAIGQLATDSNVWERFSLAGRERARLFSWDRAGEKLVEVIRRVVASQRSGGDGRF
ncbi:glycosyltransferase family 4 protein [Bradyrhizobium sp. WSM 1744]|uniref:Glycosyltransferase family 4 protein n=2 Tax=Bradyrhizobium archetypum TaxID=2721160 RepID=A0A7Y4H4U6_9BRAD|nr:glycosyltransferase family 4 protein [Bradyrhizobium archetypum]